MFFYSSFFSVSRRPPHAAIIKHFTFCSFFKVELTCEAKGDLVCGVGDPIACLHVVLNWPNRVYRPIPILLVQL
jgi:hypothetical protein